VRRAIGIIGIALPFVLLIGALILDGVGVQGSISAYYYTVMGSVFVGSLCAQGVFLISYRYRRWDSVVATFAGVLVIAVAVLPTAPADPTPTQSAVGSVHLLCATLYYLTLAYFSSFIFTRTDPAQGPPTDRKKARNRLYRVCGVVVVGCLALAAVTGMLFDGRIGQVRPLFWFETVAGLAFGTSWLVKGEFLLTDK
jgi:hypothetical protein